MVKALESFIQNESTIRQFKIKKIDSYLIVNYKIQKRLTVSAKSQLIEICRKPAPPVGFPYTVFLL